METTEKETGKSIESVEKRDSVDMEASMGETPRMKRSYRTVRMNKKSVGVFTVLVVLVGIAYSLRDLLVAVTVDGSPISRSSACSPDFFSNSRTMLHRLIGLPSTIAATNNPRPAYKAPSKTIPAITMTYDFLFIRIPRWNRRMRCIFCSGALPSDAVAISFTDTVFPASLSIVSIQITHQ
jgi:hypothetical protein